MPILLLARLLTASHIILTEKLAKCALDNHIKQVGNWMTRWAKRIVVSIQRTTGGQILHEYLKDRYQDQYCLMSH